MQIKTEFCIEFSLLQELVLRFLKRASANLPQKFHIVVPSKKLPLPEKRRLLAKQLGDFVHFYTKVKHEISCWSCLYRIICNLEEMVMFTFKTSLEMYDRSDLPDEGTQVDFIFFFLLLISELSTVFISYNNNCPYEARIKMWN